jgi:adenylate cyclase
VQDLGIRVDYSLALGLMWPGAALAQSFLLLVTWLHGCLGLHFWLRMRSWYSNNIGWFISIAALIPALALTGWINAARQNVTNLTILRADQPDEVAGYYDGVAFILGELLPKIEGARIVVLSLGLALVSVIVLHQVAHRFKKRVKVDYGNGKIITSAPGNTILEISRQAGIPHMSVCGGRARCSTCRTLIIEGKENLLPKTDAELKLLSRLNAEDSIRLACQAKITGDVTLRPLIQPQDQDIAPKTSDPLGWGVERQIAILFLDIRGFSRISEKSLPYDVVFILNSFFGEVSAAIEANNGYIDKFMGDGMMALFGLASSEMEASRNAIRAAIDCEKASTNVSRILTQHLSEPIKIGIGIHVGDAVIGRIGFSASLQRCRAR